MSIIAFRYTLQEEKQAADLSVAADADFFEMLFKAYYTKLTFFANRFLNNFPASEEIVSDTFTYLWEQRQQLNITRSANAYLYKMVQNRCLNYLKHKKIESAYVDYLIRNDLLSETSNSIIELYNCKELEIEIEKAIKQLPEKCAEVFKLSRFEQLKNREIAAQLNISQKTVERQMTIALEKMRTSLRHIFFVIAVCLAS